MPRYTITNFSRGEFAPELYGRVDVPQYNAGAREITNFILQRYGGVSFRPGFRFVGEVDDATKIHRYMPFQFSIDQAYVLTYGDEQLRVLADGGFVTEDDQKILGATNASTAVLHITFHGLAVGDRGYMDGVTGMDELNGRFATVISVPDADHVELDFDSTAFGVFIDSTGTSHPSAPAVPPPPPPPPPPVPPPPPSPTTTSPTPGEGGVGSGTYRNVGLLERELGSVP